MINVGVIGATGYAGAELVRILSDHPGVSLTKVTSRQYAGVAFEDIYPSMRGRVDLVCEAFSVKDFSRNVDVAFIALPHKLPMEIIPELIGNDIRVIDLSADFRFNTVEKYEAHYQRHTCKQLLDISVYGLSEINRAQIRDATLIGNPGCYPTSALLPLVPLLRQGLIDTRILFIDAKSGVSGAGRGASLTTHFCEVNESFKAYKVAEHRHTPEIEETLSIEAQEDVTVTFVPHLVPLSRGMLTTIYTVPKKKVDLPEIRDYLESFYKESPFIRICPNGAVPDMLHVRGTNYCDIGVKIDSHNASSIILISAIDNLVKGAAGQAVQNMNIMLGLNEKIGLDKTPYPI